MMEEYPSPNSRFQSVGGPFSGHLSARPVASEVKFAWQDLELDTGERMRPGTPFIAMELIDGKSLDRVLSKSGLPLDEFLDIAVQIAKGLAEAHAHGIVHRDLKPQNVVMTATGARPNQRP